MLANISSLLLTLLAASVVVADFRFLPLDHPEMQEYMARRK
jgi:hypothetical protein